MTYMIIYIIYDIILMSITVVLSSHTDFFKKNAEVTSITGINVLISAFLIILIITAV